MKKFCLLLLAPALHALPIGNTADAALFETERFYSVDAGFYGSYVYNRHMYTPDGGNSVQTFQLNTSAGMVAVNLWDRVSVFATFGASNVSFATNGDKLRPAGYTLKGQETELVTNDAFSWSVGGSGTVFTFADHYALGFEGQYFRTKPDIVRMTFERSHTTNPTDRQATYTEWQLGSALCYYLTPSVFPYLGLSWSRADADFGSGRITFANGASYDIPNMQNERPWAYSAGFTVSFYEQLNCTVEGRFAGELGLYLNGAYRY